MVRRAVFTTAYSSCECVIIFIFLRGRFPRFGLFIIFFVVMVLSFFFLSWRSRRRLQTPHASLIEESVDVQAWRQMHLHSRIHVVSVVIVQSVKKKKWSCDDGSGLTKSGAARRENECCGDFLKPSIQYCWRGCCAASAPDRFCIISVISHIHLRGEAETYFSDCHLFTFSRPIGTHFSDLSLLQRVKFLSPVLHL